MEGIFTGKTIEEAVQAAAQSLGSKKIRFYMRFLKSLRRGFSVF